MRTLLLATAAVAVLLGGFAHWRDAKRREWRAGETLLNRGGSVGYVDGRPIAEQSRWIQLLARVLPDECLRTAIWVEFPRSTDDEKLALLVDLPHTRTLHLDELEHVTPAGLAPLSGLAELEFLYLKNTPAGDAGLAHLRSRHNLQEMWLRGANISDASMPWIGSNRRLTHLDLDGSDIHDESLVHLSQLQNLEVLSLGRSPITSRGLASLAGLPRLKHLYLWRTGIDDAGLAHLERIATLRGLDVRYTAVTPAGRERLKRALPRCQFVE